MCKHKEEFMKQNCDLFGWFASRNIIHNLKSRFAIKQKFD